VRLWVISCSQEGLSTAENAHKELSGKVDANGQKYKRQLWVQRRPQRRHVGILVVAGGSGMAVGCKICKNGDGFFLLSSLEVSLSATLSIRSGHGDSACLARQRKEERKEVKKRKKFSSRVPLFRVVNIL
jgi:hypothetical protein